MSFELKKIKGGRISMNKKTFLFMFLAVGVAVIFSTGAASAANTNNNTTAVNITTNHVTISGFNNIGTIFKVTSNINSNNAKDSSGGIFSRGTVNQQTVSYISGNTAKDGGGIYNSGSLKLTNCYNTGTITSVTSMLGAPFTPIVYQNKAPGNGAGVTNGPLQTVSYISGNIGGICGGIYKSGSSKLTDCYNTGTITSVTSMFDIQYLQGITNKFYSGDGILNPAQSSVDVQVIKTMGKQLEDNRSI